jgi:uncharacterized glyoxalase superfamily protein PhnB
MTEQTTSDARPETLSQPPARTVWPCLAYRDAQAAIRFLVDAFCFVETLVVPGDAPADGRAGRAVAHAELRWPEGGGVMLGSVGDDPDNPFEQQPAGVGSVYVVTEHPDALLARSTAAGAQLVRGIEDTDYGSRGFTVRDPEGVLWSFGTYVGS